MADLTDNRNASLVPAVAPKEAGAIKGSFKCMVELTAHTAQVICALLSIWLIKKTISHLFASSPVFFEDIYPIKATTLLDAIDLLILVEFGAVCLVKVFKALTGSCSE